LAVRIPDLVANSISASCSTAPRGWR
jgi:hypothetical protein